jgi:hypothetical protein
MAALVELLAFATFLFRTDAQLGDLQAILLASEMATGRCRARFLGAFDIFSLVLELPGDMTRGFVLTIAMLLTRIVSLSPRLGFAYRGMRRVGPYRPWVYHRGMINYLKIDPTMPEPYGRPLWLPVIQAGTPFETSAQAETVKTQIPGATGVVESAGAWYVVKDSVSNRVRKIYLTQHEG